LGYNFDVEKFDATILPCLEQFFLLKLPKSDSELHFAASCLINDYEICHKE
jgi:hypothetical protein